MLLNQSDLNLIRGDQMQMLPDIADMTRPSMVNTPTGQVRTYVSYKQVRCRIAPVGDRRSESVVQDFLWKDIQTESFLHVATVPMGTDAQINDRMIVRGREYEIVARLTD